MKAFLFLTLSFGLLARATDTATDLHVQEQGQMFQVRAVPSKGQTEFFVLGNKAAKINFKNLQMSGKYYVDGKERPLSFTKSANSFLSKDPIEDKEIQLDLQDERQKVDHIHMKLHGS